MLFEPIDNYLALKLFGSISFIQTGTALLRKAEIRLVTKASSLDAEIYRTAIMRDNAEDDKHTVRG